MSVKALTYRNIIGTFFEQLRASEIKNWTNKLMMTFPTDQPEEVIKWLGATPAMRKWVGPRVGYGLKDNGITIQNEAYEATLRFFADDIRRDKTPQIMTRIREMATRAAMHWNKLAIQAIIDGESTACYDGQYFFDTDHSEGDSGTQSNDITYTASTATDPTAAEMAGAIGEAIAQILTFKDDKGEPMNEDASSFGVLLPAGWTWKGIAATRSEVIIDTNSKTNELIKGDFSIDVWPTARLDSSWTTKIAVFRTDGIVKPLIGIDEYGVKMSAKGAGSEFEHDTNMHEYGIKANRGVGYGYWQHACLVTFS